MLKQLINLANHLDSRGLMKEADYLDSVILKLSSSNLKSSEEVMFLEDRDFEGYNHRIDYNKATILHREAEPGIDLYPQIDESIRSMVMGSEDYEYVQRNEYDSLKNQSNTVYLDKILQVENDFTPEDNYIICLVVTNSSGKQLFYYKRFKDMENIKSFDPEKTYKDFDLRTGMKGSELHNSKNLLDRMIQSGIGPEEEMDGFTMEGIKEHISKLESELEDAGYSEMKRQPGYSGI